MIPHGTAGREWILVCREFMKVRDVIRILHEDGWVLVAMRGSHKQFKRPVKQGRVTVPGQPGDDLARGTLKSIF